MLATARISLKCSELSFYFFLNLYFLEDFNIHWDNILKLLENLYSVDSH